MTAFNIVNAIIIIGLIISAVSIFILDDVLQCIIATSVLGTFLALEFLLLKAPDVAIAEGAVAILTPVIFIITLNKVKRNKNKEEKNG